MTLNLQFFLERLRFWSKCENHKGKYLDLIKSLQDSGRIKEKERIENEVHNRVIDPNDQNVIEIIIDSMEKWFGKPKEDVASESWDKFVEYSRKKDTNVEDFILDFESLVSKLLTVIPNIPKIIIALQLLRAINVDEIQRRSILANIKFDISNENIYDELKSSMRLLKGSLVEK